MKSLYQCPVCQKTTVRSSNEPTVNSFCKTSNKVQVLDRVNVDCEALEVVAGGFLGFYVYIEGNGLALYLHNDGKVKNTARPREDSSGWFKTREAAQAALDKFKGELMCDETAVQEKAPLGISAATKIPAPSSPLAENVVVKSSVTNRNIFIDHQGSIEANFSAKLVHSGETESDFGQLTLEVATPFSGARHIPVARLEFKEGKLVMYRERGAFDPYINTDEEGRIQN